MQSNELQCLLEETLAYKAQLSCVMVTVHYWVYTDRTQNGGKDVEQI